MSYIINAHVSQIIKTTSKLLLIILFINMSICFADNNASNGHIVPSKVTRLPISYSNNDIKESSLDISIYAATILIVVVSIIALIITFVTFIVPFILITTTDFQMSFFKTVMDDRFLSHVRNSRYSADYIKIIEKMSEDVCITAKRSNQAARAILAFSFFLLLGVTICAIYSYLSYNFEWLLEIFIAATILEIVFILSIILGYFWSISKNNYRLKLAKIQRTAIIDNLKDIDNDKSHKTDRSINASFGEININFGKGGVS